MFMKAQHEQTYYGRKMSTGETALHLHFGSVCSAHQKEATWCASASSLCSAALPLTQVQLQPAYLHKLHSHASKVLHLN